ncbi:MFS transporter [Rhodococcus spelaei]|uniref:MFS transporter n=1 Tax=Rhodococcus spelaei TaxID=2546320 RepID=A0A541BSL6_9NOCA|nr:MFS transporter [Rhodococcus spelaei]
MIVATLSVTGVVVALQQTLVVPILPDFSVALGVSPTTTSWLVTATLLTGAVATPLIGRLADLTGKRAMMLLCLAVMVAGSTIAALGQTFPVVVTGRVMQGFAIALLPVGISLLRDLLEPARLGGAVALMSGTMGIGSMFGMPMAGVIYAHLGWHALFWVTGGVGLALAILLVVAVPESSVRARGRFDHVGAVMLTIALTTLLLAISKGGQWGWGSPATLGCVAVGAATLAVWVPMELRIPDPLVDLRTSVLRPVLISNVCAALLGFAMFLSAYTATQELQAPVESGYGPGLSEAAAGMAMMPGGLLMVVLAPLSARMTRRRGARVTLVIGAIVIAAGYVLRAVLGPSVVNVTTSAAMISGGVALALAAMPVLITEAVPIDQTATANGVNSLLRSVGTSTASAVGAAVLASSTLTVVGVTVPTLSAFTTMYWIGAAAAVAAVAVALLPLPART